MPLPPPRPPFQVAAHVTLHLTWLSRAWLSVAATPNVGKYSIIYYLFSRCGTLQVELVCLFPLVSLLIVNKPQDMGLLPDGDGPAHGRGSAESLPGSVDGQGAAALLGVGAREADEGAMPSTSCWASFRALLSSTAAYAAKAGGLRGQRRRDRGDKATKTGWW